MYPLQAFARLHASGDDPQALAAAEAVATAICAAQGEAGQWWWHYDSRDGSVVEGYPVYSVHQHAMGPMALLDLADAGGTGHDEAISRGLSWLAGPAGDGRGADPGRAADHVAEGGPRRPAQGGARGPRGGHRDQAGVAARRARQGLPGRDRRSRVPARTSWDGCS